jgi:hypothetical protein
MNENRLPDYLDHIRQAATDVCAYIEGMSKSDPGQRPFPGGRR